MDLEIKPERAPPRIHPIRALEMTNPFITSAVPFNSGPSVGMSLPRNLTAQMVAIRNKTPLVIHPFLLPSNLTICAEIIRIIR
jgi:hypothetical protein